MHWPFESFHLHAGIVDYFYHGGQRYQNFVLQHRKINKISCKLVGWNFEGLDVLIVI